MFQKNNMQEINESELNQLLLSAENDQTSHTLFAVADKLQPRAAYVNDLERKLRGAAMPKTSSPFNWKPLLLAGASLVLLALVVGFFWFKQPAPVSAQQVLSRAAATQLPPNATVHRIYTMEGFLPTQSSGNADVWLQADGTGNLARMAFTFTSLYQDGSRHSVWRLVMNGNAVETYEYNPSGNMVRIERGNYDQLFGDNPNPFDGASVAKYLNKVMSGKLSGVQLLAPQSLLGHSVYALRDEENGGGSSTYYFEAQTYVMVGADTPETRVRLTSDEIVPVNQLNPDAFSFTPPPNATVVTGDPFAK